MRFTIVFALLASAGCEKNLLGATDAAGDAGPCPRPAQPLAPGSFKVFLNTEGVTLTKGNCDDSRTNCSAIPTTDGTVVPPFLPGAPDRATFIDMIASTTQGVLAPYSIDIVTTRPVTGDYDMIVLGGNGAQIANCPNCGYAGPFTCEETTNRDHILLAFDYGETTADPTSYTANDYADSMLSAVGIMVGLAPSTEPDDCVCNLDTPCTKGPDDHSLCAFGSTVSTTLQLFPNGQPINCGLTPTEDEPALLKAALGCR